jgi:hypothetical protein
MSASHPNRISEGGPFDTDSSLIGIDNRCSGCITHIRTDIPGELVECSRAIKGFGGTKVFRVWTGTIAWDWDDDNGQTHHMIIPKSYYVPDGNIRLLSPQHWSQHRTGADKHGGAGETTTATHVTLFWGNRQYTKTVPLDLGTNVATFRTSAGYDKFHAYCAECGTTDIMASDSKPLTESEVQAEMQAMDAAAISDVDTDDDEDSMVSIASDIDEYENTAWPAQTDAPRTFDVDGPVQKIDLTPKKIGQVRPGPVTVDEEDRIEDTPTSQLLRAHHDFGHAPFPKLQEMARQGILSPKLAKCNVPICSACKYAKATKRPWRSKTAKNWSKHGASPPKVGEVVSVDQLVSPTPGLIAQMTGFITKQ